MPASGVHATPIEWLARVCFVLLIICLPGPIAAMSITAGLTVPSTLVLWLVTRPRLEASPVAWPAVGWLVALAVSAAFAIDPAQSWPRLGKALFPALVPLAAFHASNRKDAPKLVTVLLLSSAVGAAFGAVSFLERGASFDHRARGLVGHYMTFGGQLLLLVSLAAGILVTSRTPRWRWMAGLAASLGAIALACTYTRSAQIGLAAAMAIIVGLWRWRWLPALAALLAVVYLLLPGGVRARLDSSFDSRHPHNVERAYMWQAGWRMFRERPWTGIGTQDLRAIYPRYQTPGAAEIPGHLHSNLVQIAATMGIPGLLAFAALFGSLFVAAGAGLGAALARDELAAGIKIGVIGGLVGFLVAGSFEWNFGDEELLYLLYVLVGLAWAARLWPRQLESAAVFSDAPRERAQAVGAAGS